MQNYKGIVNALETFGSVDGPGVRFVVFLQGCNMRCKYCHNPETWARSCSESTVWTAQELFDKAWRYKFYWGKDMSNGGITVSGGEPLLQIDFLIEFFKLAKAKGVHTTIDTAGQPFSRDEEFLKKFLEDLEFTDIKAYDETLHRSVTGVVNSNIFDMMKYLSDNGKKMWVRRVLVPNLTDSEEDLKKTADFIDTLKTVEKVEILPYHSLGLFKWEKLNIPYSLKDTRSPTKEEVEKAEIALRCKK